MPYNNNVRQNKTTMEPTMTKQSLKISFDNAGGITLETSEYCHFFGEYAEEAANATNAILNGESTQYWDGNEPEHRLEDSETQHYFEDIQSILNTPLDELMCGYSQMTFYKALKSLNPKYFVIQKGYCFFGCGDTPKQAWEDAKEVIDNPEREKLSVEELPSYNQAQDGDMCVVSEEEYNQGKM